MKQGLSLDCPIAVLNRHLGYTYGVHWMTITNYTKYSDDSRYIYVSTWGEKTCINYRTYHSMGAGLGGGFI